jgi:hypothetical protein
MEDRVSLQKSHLLAGPFSHLVDPSLSVSNSLYVGRRREKKKKMEEKGRGCVKQGRGGMSVRKERKRKKKRGRTCGEWGKRERKRKEMDKVRDTWRKLSG